MVEDMDTPEKKDLPQTGNESTEDQMEASSNDGESEEYHEPEEDIEDDDVSVSVSSEQLQNTKQRFEAYSDKQDLLRLQRENDLLKEVTNGDEQFYTNFNRLIYAHDTKKRKEYEKSEARERAELKETIQQLEAEIRRLQNSNPGKGKSSNYPLPEDDYALRIRNDNLEILTMQQEAVITTLRENIEKMRKDTGTRKESSSSDQFAQKCKILEAELEEVKLTLAKIGELLGRKKIGKHECKESEVQEENSTEKERSLQNDFESLKMVSGDHDSEFLEHYEGERKGRTRDLK
jgi:hypothetical protein